MKIQQLQTYNNYSLQNNNNQNRKYNYYANTSAITSTSGNPSFGDLKAPKKLTNFVHDYFTVPVMNIGSKIIKTDNDNLLNHMQTAGSAVMSGMYMYRTLNNDQLDETKKKTLAVNQFLTFVASTIGAYFLDSMLDKFSEKISFNYTAKKLSKAYESMNKDTIFENAKTELENSRNAYNATFDFNKDLKKAKSAQEIKTALENFKSTINIEDSNNRINKAVDKLINQTETETEFKQLKQKIKDGFKNTVTKKSQASNAMEAFANELKKNKNLKNLAQYNEFFETLGKTLVGVGVFKKLAIFTMIYRFVSPIAVTPVANMIGNKMFEKKDEVKN